MRRAPHLIALAFAGPCLGAPSLIVTSDPPVPVENLIQNPGFETGADNQPTGWRFSTARPEIFDEAWADGGNSGDHSARVTANSAEMSGYWSQTVEVSPKRYVFSGNFRLAAGRILVYANAASRAVDPPVEINQRFYAGTVRGHWLVPVFIPPEALTGADEVTYQPFRMVFDVPEGITHAALNLGMYFEAGEVWFDDVWCGLADTSLMIRVDPDGGQLKKLVVYSSLDGKAVYVSPDGEPPALEVTLDDVAADASYTVVAEMADGQTIRSTYPDGGGQ